MRAISPCLDIILPQIHTMTTHYSVPVDLNKLPDVQFSRLEASLAQILVEQRRMSRAADDIHRHLNPEDLAVDEFEFDDSLNPKDYPLYQSQYLPDVLSAVHFHKHLINDLNFSSDTSINCLKVDSQSQEWLIVNDETLNNLISEYSLPPKNLSTSPPRKLLAFFIPRIPQTNSSFGNQVTIRKDSVKHLFDTLDVDPSFIMNLLGRPDYWAPCAKLGWDANNELTSCEFSCQHPRWNLNVQGSPLSAYMRFDRVRNLTLYIVAHKQQDTSISTLQQLIGLGMESVDAKGQNEKRKTSMFLDDPFHIHVMLSYLSFEASKHHVKRFQRFMWTQINKVDDHLAGFVKSDRSKLSGLTKDLQVISQNADSHIANAEVAILCAEGIQRAHVRFHNAVKSPKIVFEHTADTVQYVAASIRKQKMWFNNYKDRKDGTMNLVYNLVTQQDAINNISLAIDMRKDSASMSAIASLTMVFLPGTFTASLLSAGIFSASFGSSSANSSIQVSSMWWLFIAITVPLTIVVFVSWRIYHK
ncbi:hypothetical protein D9758_004227 [Tetrapyrgos nigripes]|uniref:Uncharacterized protein n=1 Tax=Tetrapyrgos nigripes TaxID=182062 RepID=A0A8H5GU32_9AGAR|nr:hypothetical protein D9758_004227 [Tetrapyrgos nigripes]